MKTGTINVTIESIKTCIVLALLFYSTFILLSQFPMFYVYVMESIVYGISMWIIMGIAAPFLIYYVFLLPFKIKKTNLYLINRGPQKDTKSAMEVILKSVNSSITPTFLAFGILNLILNYFDFVLGLGFMVFVYIVVVGLGTIIPLIWTTSDSNLVIIDAKNQVVQPVGILLRSYLRGISGFVAIVGFLYTLFSLTGDLSVSIYLLLAVLSLTFPAIFVVNTIYMIFHPYFVSTLNKLLPKAFKACKVKIEVNTSTEEARFLVNNTNE